MLLAFNRMCMTFYAFYKSNFPPLFFNHFLTEKSTGDFEYSWRSKSLLSFFPSSISQLFRCMIFSVWTLWRPEREVSLTNYNLLCLHNTFDGFLYCFIITTRKNNFHFNSFFKDHIFPIIPFTEETKVSHATFFPCRLYMFLKIF